MLKPRLSIQQQRATGRYHLHDHTGAYHATTNVGGWGAPNTPAADATAYLHVLNPHTGAVLRQLKLEEGLLRGCTVEVDLPLADGAYLLDYRIESRHGVPLTKCSYRLSVANVAPPGNRLLVARADAEGVPVWVDVTGEATTTAGITAWQRLATTDTISAYRLTLANGTTILEEGVPTRFDCFTSALATTTTERPALVGSSVTGLLVDRGLSRKIARAAAQLTAPPYGVATQDYHRRQDDWAVAYYEWQALRLTAATLGPTAVADRLARLHRLADRLSPVPC